MIGSSVKSRGKLGLLYYIWQPFWWFAFMNIPSNLALFRLKPCCSSFISFVLWGSVIWSWWGVFILSRVGIFRGRFWALFFLSYRLGYWYWYSILLELNLLILCYKRLLALLFSHFPNIITLSMPVLQVRY